MHFAVARGITTTDEQYLMHFAVARGKTTSDEQYLVQFRVVRYLQANKSISNESDRNSYLTVVISL